MHTNRKFCFIVSALIMVSLFSGCASQPPVRESLHPWRLSAEQPVTWGDTWETKTALGDTTFITLCHQQVPCAAVYKEYFTAINRKEGKAIAFAGHSIKDRETDLAEYIQKSNGNEYSVPFDTNLPVPVGVGMALRSFTQYAKAAGLDRSESFRELQKLYGQISRR